MEIRLMSELDNISTISHVYEESWKQAYKGLIPQDYLDSIPKGHWVNALKSGIWKNMIMLDGKQIVGTAAYCASRDEKLKDWGEIVSIYLLPEYIGKGYGKKLFQRVLNALIAEGYKAIYLWVLEGNSRAMKFYEAFGFQANGVYLEDCIGGKKVREIQYIYYVE